MPSFKFIIMSSALGILAAACEAPAGIEKTDSPDIDHEVSFVDVTREAGLRTVPTWKYGGPAIADLDHDGHYDLLLANHHVEPVQLFWGQSDHTFIEHSGFMSKVDAHGLAAGDYDGDGDADILVSLGGGNGTTPRPPLFFKNNNGEFEEAADVVGIGAMGGRGRTVKWIDIDNDGDLDMIQITAIQLQDGMGPKNFAFENTGDGQFKYRSMGSAFEGAEAERLLLTDIDNDGWTDLISFTPLKIWKNTGDFAFDDVTLTVLPEELHEIDFVSAVAETDFDNDGDFDLYLARGKTYYQLADDSHEFIQETGRLNIRDQGSNSTDSIDFIADGNVVLTDFWHWKWDQSVSALPVFLGANKSQIQTPEVDTEITPEAAAGVPATFDENGWYLMHLGEDRWRLQSTLRGNVAWGIRASVLGVESVESDWDASARNVSDLLLVNDGGSFSLSDSKLPEVASDNNWGVINGDFNNDGFDDLFVYRFGGLRSRVPDALYINSGDGSYTSSLTHGAFPGDGNSHGDMGAAFDYDQDGWVDILSGDDNPGAWHLYKNEGQTNGNSSVTVRVGYSPSDVDPLGATIEVTAGDLSLTKRVGSTGAVHSQDVLNIAHFGLGKNKKIDQLTVRWRNGESAERRNVEIDETLVIGHFPSSE